MAVVTIRHFLFLVPSQSRLVRETSELLISPLPFRPASDQPSAYPYITWQVGLSIGNSLCGGSIIDATHVLTAAHCLRSISSNIYANPASITVNVGLNRRFPAYRRTAKTIWVEPSYRSSMRPTNAQIDLGIIEVSEPFVFSSSIQPISLCSSASCWSVPNSPDKIFVSGFGMRVSEVSSTVSDELIYAFQDAVSQTDCVNRWNSQFSCSSCFPLNNICAAGPANNLGSDSCFGDSGKPKSNRSKCLLCSKNALIDYSFSGGPLVRDFGSNGGDFQLVGVVSSGTVPANKSPACGGVNDYGVYVAVEPNLPWIRSVTSGDQSSTGITSDCVNTGTCTTPTSGDGGSIQNSGYVS